MLEEVVRSVLMLSLPMERQTENRQNIHEKILFFPNLTKKIFINGF